MKLDHKLFTRTYTHFGADRDSLKTKVTLILCVFSGSDVEVVNDDCYIHYYIQQQNTSLA